MQVKRVGRPTKYEDVEFQKYLQRYGNLTYLCMRHYVRAICKMKLKGVDFLDSYSVRAYVRGNDGPDSMYDVPAYNHYVDFLLKVKNIARPHIDKRRRPFKFNELHIMLQTYAHLVQYMQHNMDVTFNEVRNLTYAQAILPPPEGTRGAFHLTEPVRIGLLSHLDFQSDWGAGWEQMGRNLSAHHKLPFGAPPEDIRTHYVFSHLDDVHMPLPYEDWFAIIDTKQISLRQFHRNPTDASNGSTERSTEGDVLT